MSKCTTESLVVHMMQQIEKKTEVPEEQPHFASKGRVLKDDRKLKEYKKKEETIELTMLLVGGTKKRRSDAI